MDVGCGLGHFVNCSIGSGLDARGIDVNRTMIQHGNIALEKYHSTTPLACVAADDINSVVRNTEVDVLSAMAVMEHLADLQGFVEAVQNSSFEYFYYSVPTYSLSVTIENLFENVYPRHLSAGHTHLFTETSLNELNKRLGVQPIAEWRFGTDVMDLVRSIDVSLAAGNASDIFRARVKREISGYLDKLQLVIDESHNCSQIHVLCRKL